MCHCARQYLTCQKFLILMEFLVLRTFLLTSRRQEILPFWHISHLILHWQVCYLSDRTVLSYMSTTTYQKLSGYAQNCTLGCPTLVVRCKEHLNSPNISNAHAVQELDNKPAPPNPTVLFSLPLFASNQLINFLKRGYSNTPSGKREEHRLFLFNAGTQLLRLF